MLRLTERQREAIETGDRRWDRCVGAEAWPKG